MTFDVSSTFIHLEDDFPSTSFRMVSLPNHKFLIELSITQFSSFFNNLKLKKLLALAAILAEFKTISGEKDKTLR